MYIDTIEFPKEIVLKIIYNSEGISKWICIVYKKIYKCRFKKTMFLCNNSRVSIAKCNLSYINENNLIEIKKVIIKNKSLKKIYLCFGCAH